MATMGNELIAVSDGELRRLNGMIQLRRETLQEKTTKQHAMFSLKMIMGAYPTQKPKDPKIYTRTIIALLLKYPKGTVDAIADPQEGIATLCEYLPTIAEIANLAKKDLQRHYDQIRKYESDLRYLEEQRELANEKSMTPEEWAECNVMWQKVRAGMVSRATIGDKERTERRRQLSIRSQGSPEQLRAAHIAAGTYGADPEPIVDQE